MRDEDNGLTRERDRRVQGGILIAMVVMIVVGVFVAFLEVLGFPGAYLSSAPEQRSVLEVEVPRPDWPRFVEATDRFAEKRGLFMLKRSAGPLIKESASTVWLSYHGDQGVSMIVDAGKKGQFVVTFTDRYRNGAEQMLERAFRADVIAAGGFRPLP
ncbi:MAG: hypothetical protein Q8N31_07390 [Reyranella sp.]|nr:hypothetical protein [Reyranella sp.]MDP3159821.1 hypothetical protein [Reyranella sp.]